MRASSLGLVLLLCLFALSGCSDEGSSKKGGGADRDGGADASAENDGDILPDAGDDCPGDGEGLPYGEACSDDCQCESRACFVGGRFAYCSVRCTTANAEAVCTDEKASGECNKRGFCKMKGT